ncbi:glycoside hydrolase family 31 protein [Halobacillus salinarum]|uniref:Glycoside hydrolase family 31 protein n=1 Tax=Halobacillus salinarum TaxID=2932257 RepID=A0ABY4ENL0_9BACI|nr:glycoside hydrolase family 31 protein [Halobacillus salinarum]UOQ45575.1 glycoside hydrolase family 31 protein [Halobacillus salinarum]
MITTIRFTLDRINDNELIFKGEEQQVHLYILEEGLFRVYSRFDELYSQRKTWAVAPGMTDVPFEGRDRFDLTPFHLPAYEVKEEKEKVHIWTNSLKATVHLNGFFIDWYTKRGSDWVKIAGDRKTQSYNFNKQLGDGVYHYMERTPEERYYGLGEKSGEMNRHHKRYQMRTIDAMGYDAERTDPLYKFIPFYLVHSQETSTSYGIYYDNYADSVFDMGAELDNYHGLYRYYQSKKGDLDYYFMLGPSISDVVKTYTWLTGKMIFPPKWSLGYSGSTMTYTDAPDAQEQLKKFVEACKQFDIPCDSFQLSSGYTSKGDKRYVFNWNTSKVPDPVGMNEHFHEHGIAVCANIKPVLLDDHPFYKEAAERGLFIKDHSGIHPEISQFWDALGSYLDFTNRDTITWWKEKVKETLLDYGIDSTWNDNNEYEVWDDRAVADGFGDPLPLSYLKPIQTLLMMKASYDAQKEHAPEKRPYLISRSGGPGLQRYVQTWSGDNFTEWKTIRYNLKMGLSLSLSGVYNFGHDVGGFAGKAPEPELFIRWIQNGIFHPRFTIHSWNEDQTVNVPWMYPDHVEEIRHWMKERVKWIPYLYHLLHEAHVNNEPMLTPTFYHFEQDEKTFEENDEFMVGRSLLIANVMDKGQTKRTVYLPDHAGGWYDINASEWYAGGEEVTVDAPLSKVPMFAQAGSVFPICDGDISFEHNSDQSRGLLVFPRRGDGEVEQSFYEDDGETLEYQENHCSWITVKTITTEEQVDVQVKVEGEYPLSYETISVYFPETEKRLIQVNQQPLDGKSIQLSMNDRTRGGK